MISDLRLRQFRSYEDSSFEFGDGVNIVVGPNASGKTNLLEAILVVGRGSSYRANDTDLIMHNQTWSRIDAHHDHHLRVLKMKHQNGTVKKEYKIDGTTLSRLTLGRMVPTVLFEPNHLQLLTRSPEQRRNFIDDIIEQTVPGFGQLRRNYRRALAQRNSLLKQAHRADQLFVWNLRISEMGGQIAERRLEFVDTHSSQLAVLYAKLADKSHEVSLAYHSKIAAKNYGSALLKGLEASLDIDKERGFTMLGPHRDDIVPMLDGHPLHQAASRGETRTILLALKLLELASIEAAHGLKPILLLDDVFSELDGARRRALTEFLRDHQTFITTTDADIVVQHFLDSCTVIPTG